jgi:hypothetical protein
MKRPQSVVIYLTKCSYPGCSDPIIFARKLCNRHYRKWRAAAKKAGTFSAYDTIEEMQAAQREKWRYENPEGERQLMQEQELFDKQDQEKSRGK